MKKLLVHFLFTVIVSISFSVVYSQKPELILPIGHTKHTFSAIYSPDEKYVLTAAADNTAKLWECGSGKLVRTLQTTTGIGKTAFSPDGRLIMLISDFSNVTLWETSSGKLLKTLQHTAFVNSSSFNSKGNLIITGCSNNINIWDVQSGELIKTIKDSSKIISAEFFDYDKKILSVTDNKTLKIWKQESGETILSYRDSDYIFDSRILINENQALLKGLKKAILIDLSSGKPVRTFGSGKGTVSKIDLSSDETLILIGYFSNNSPEVWDVNTGKLLYRLPNDFLINLALFRPNHNSIITSSLDKIKIWNQKTGTLIDSIMVENISYGSFDKSGNYFLANSMYANDFTASIWNIDAHRVSMVFRGSSYKLNNAVFSPDGKKLLTSNFDFPKIWDIQSGKLINVLSGHMRETTSAVFSYDGKLIITSSEDATVKIWDSQTWNLIRSVIDYASHGILSVAISRDNKLIATANSGNSSVDLIDVSTGKIVTVIKSPEKYEFLSVAFSPDGKMLATSAWDKTARIWDPSTGKLLQTMEHKSNKVSSVSFSPDGKYLITASQDYSAKIWDPVSGKLIRSLPHDEWVNSAEFSPDGKFILTASDDKTVKIWNSETYDLVKSLIHPAPVQTATFNPSANLIVTCSGDNFCRIWDANQGELLYSFCSIQKEDYVFLLPSGEYMGTTNGVRRLSWRLNNKLYDFDQWDLQYNRPDKVLEKLGNPDTTLIKMYRKAYEKRLKKAGFTENMFTPEWHTPEMRIMNSEELKYITDQPQLQLNIHGTDSKYNIDRLFVWINDVPLYSANGISMRGELKQSADNLILIPLSTGDNEIKVSCMNEKGVESLKESVSIVYNPVKTVRPDLYVITMSVSVYQDERYDLRYAAKDGRDIASMFNSLSVKSENYRHIFIDTLINKKATRENFLNLKKKLLSSGVDDEIVVFVSGHGLLDKNFDFYFASYDMDFAHPEKRGISYDELEYLLDSIPARKKLLLVDACHSGEVDKEGNNEMLALNTEASSDLTFRGAIKEFSFRSVNNSSEQQSITLNDSFELMQEFFTSLDNGTGATVISAAAGKGYALESPQWNNGVFTYSIINGLKNKAADSNKDGIISISELKDYSIKQVQLLTGGRQKPTARRESINYDWRIW